MIRYTIKQNTKSINISITHMGRLMIFLVP